MKTGHIDVWPVTQYCVEATAGFEPAMGVLQTPALPLGDVAIHEAVLSGSQQKPQCETFHQLFAV
jgi:hypothetical protein